MGVVKGQTWLMNKTEVKFWTMLKDHMPGDVSRVENMVDVGTPDVSGAFHGDYWVELKVSSNKEKEQDVLKLLEPSQKVWHYKRGKCGSLIFVFVQYRGWFLIYEYWYIKGATHGRKNMPDNEIGLYIIKGKYSKVKGKWEWGRFETEFEQFVREG